MATIRSYTTIEQSRKLAKILPFESADMYYDGFGRLPQGYAYTLISPNSFEYDYPCWSLAALISILPNPELIQNSEGTWLVRSWVNMYPWSVGGYSNPVDACVAMIEKLHELNLL